MQQLALCGMSRLGWSGVASGPAGWVVLAPIGGELNGHPVLQEAAQLSRRHGQAYLINLAADLPAAVLADLLGMHINTAVRWVKRARRDWASYLGARAEATRTGQARNMAEVGGWPGSPPPAGLSPVQSFGPPRAGKGLSVASTTVVATRRETVMSEADAWPDDRRITIHDLQAATDRGERWSMLTSYDTLTAGVFEQAGVRALLVGDTSAEMVLGYRDTLPVTMDQLIPMVQAVVRGTRTALVVADLPFGSYQAGPEAALANAVRHLKEGGAQAVKLEGGRRVLAQVESLVARASR